MQCKSCQAQLPPRTAFCPSCGAPTPYNKASSYPDAQEGPSISSVNQQSTPAQQSPIAQNASPYQEPTAPASGYEPTVRAVPPAPQPAAQNAEPAPEPPLTGYEPTVRAARPDQQPGLPVAEPGAPAIPAAEAPIPPASSTPWQPPVAEAAPPSPSEHVYPEAPPSQPQPEGGSAQTLPFGAQGAPTSYNPPSQQPFGSSQPQPAFGAASAPQESFGSSPSQPQPFGNPPSQPVFGAASAPQESFGSSPSQPQPFGNPPSQPAFGAAQFGVPPVQPTPNLNQQAQFSPYGSSPSQPGYPGGQPGQQPFGTPPPQPGYPGGQPGQQPQGPMYLNAPPPAYYGAQPQQPGQPQPSYPGAPGQPGQMWPGQPQPQPQRRKGGMTLVLIILAIIVVVGGVAGLYAGVIHPNQLHAQATSTAQAILATQTRGTAVANTQATGTAVAQVNATATAQALEKTPQGLFTVATSGQPQINDSLASQSNTNWDSTSNSDGSGCAFTNSALHVTTSAANILWLCLAKSTTFSNFAFQAQMTITKGEAAGLLFRLDNLAQKFYLFTISTNGTYTLAYVSALDSASKVLSQATNPLVPSGTNQPITLTAIARDTSINIYANKQYITTVDDSGSGTGNVGFVAVGQKTAPTDAAFTNAEVWTL